MLISGVNHARVSGDQILDRPKVASIIAEQTAAAPAAAQNSLDHDSQNALMRFAHFLNRDGGKKKKPPEPQPRSANLLYRAQWDREQELFDRGHLLNIFA